MKPLLLQDLQNEKIEALNVLSFDPDIYLAQVIINGDTYRVYQEPGELLKEFSQLALKKHFKGLSIQQTFLIHQTAYDEMVGNPPASNNELKVKLANPDQDLS